VDGTLIIVQADQMLIIAVLDGTLIIAVLDGMLITVLKEQTQATGLIVQFMDQVHLDAEQQQKEGNDTIIAKQEETV
jgi:hypothetical protein